MEQFRFAVWPSVKSFNLQEFFVVLALVYFYPGQISPIYLPGTAAELKNHIFRHLYFVDFASYGCPVININQVTSCLPKFSSELRCESSNFFLRCETPWRDLFLDSTFTDEDLQQRGQERCNKAVLILADLMSSSDGWISCQAVGDEFGGVCEAATPRVLISGGFLQYFVSMWKIFC